MDTQRRKALAAVYTFILECMAERQSKADVRESLGRRPSRRDSAQPEKAERSESRQDTEEVQLRED